MANDREVLREVWDGRLPIKFYIAEEERGWFLLFNKLVYNIHAGDLLIQQIGMCRGCTFMIDVLVYMQWMYIVLL